MVVMLSSDGNSAVSYAVLAGNIILSRQACWIMKNLLSLHKTEK